MLEWPASVKLFRLHPIPTQHIQMPLRFVVFLPHFKLCRRNLLYTFAAETYQRVCFALVHQQAEILDWAFPVGSAFQHLAEPDFVVGCEILRAHVFRHFLVEPFQPALLDAEFGNIVFGPIILAVLR
jgi:hypothetical protein